jgi:gamma-glutamyl hercynylcysteine S-oxide synthase
MDTDMKVRLAEGLAEARRNTERLLAPIDDVTLTTQYDQLMSPVVWDYAHIGVFEELWLVQAISGAEPIDGSLEHTYNALDTPRVVRGHRKLLDRTESAAYLADVRRRTLNLLEEVDLAGDDPLLREAFVYKLVLEHEDQHDETILQTIQLNPGIYLDQRPTVPPGRPVAQQAIAVPAGTYPIGSSLHEPYDNEHPRHQARVEGFAIDRLPVSNGDYLEFIQDGGYRRREVWSPDGWEWNQTFGTGMPEYWSEKDGAWWVTSYGQRVPLDRRLPVQHVCYFEADAYARWAGKRLPTEFEWEVAAAFDPGTGEHRRYPWGDQPPTPERANLGQISFQPAPLGAYPEGASACGCEQMLGDVWEWTSSDFRPYPGFTAFPYNEYSEPFFGDGFKVLRGGSWATRASVARTTFRNWDSRLKRQIFAGLRCAQDAI